ATKESFFHQLLQQDFDMPGMARFVLGPYWRVESEPEKREFRHLFEDYIVRIYSQRFAQYHGEARKVTGSRSGPEGAIVTSEIVRSEGRRADQGQVAAGNTRRALQSRRRHYRRRQHGGVGTRRIRIVYPAQRRTSSRSAVDDAQWGDRAGEHAADRPPSEPRKHASTALIQPPASLRRLVTNKMGRSASEQPPADLSAGRPRVGN